MSAPSESTRCGDFVVIDSVRYTIVAIDRSRGTLTLQASPVVSA
jgi:hypothetical protein